MILLAFKQGRRVLDNINMIEERLNRINKIKISGLLVASLLVGDIASDFANRTFISYSQPEYIKSEKKEVIRDEDNSQYYSIAEKYN